MEQEEGWAWATAGRGHGPRTMGETAKCPAGVAGFLKEKSQSEVLRGRLASDIPVPPTQTSNQTEAHSRGQWGRGSGQRSGWVASLPRRDCLHSSLPSCPPAGAPGGPARLRAEAEEKEREEQSCGPNAGTHDGQRLIGLGT